MDKAKLLQCASLTAKYTNYEDFLHEDGSKTQEKTWTFTAQDLRVFLTAIKVAESE